MSAADDATRLCKALQTDTHKKPMAWRSLATIAVRARLKDPKSIEAAVKLAVANDWLLVEGGHSVALTDAGRRL